MKKIMFNDKYGLTDAVLCGRKTMTRRIVQERYLRIYEDMSRLGQPCYPLEEWLIRKAAAYKVGEVVAVAQNYHGVYEELKRTHGSSSRVTREFFHKYVQGGRVPVTNKMFVKADLMPYKIRITDIKVERLQDISEDDCLKEGIIKKPHPFVKEAGWVYCMPNDSMDYVYPTQCFADLIDKVSGKGTWEHNPYVFAYTFELVK